MKPCPTCGKDVADPIAKGELICPSCASPLAHAGEPGTSRAILRLSFWAMFLGTPVLAILTAKGGAGFLFLIAGAFVAGGILARLYAKNEGARVSMTVLFGFMLLFVYCGIAFAGCLLILKGMHI
jgi:hypothetical protein